MIENFKILGHRGNQGSARENSYDAIMDCFRWGCIDGVELDIRPTADNKIVVVHDAIVTGNNKVQDLTLKELDGIELKTKFADVFLQQLFAAFYRDKYFFERYHFLGSQTSKILTFNRIMKDFSKDKHMLIELKGELEEYSKQKQEIFERNIVELLQQYDYKNRDLALQGYNYDALFRIKDRLPDLKVVALVNNRSGLKYLDRGFDGANIKFNIIDETVIGKIVKNNMSLYSWDDKKSIPHYKKANAILEEYKDEIESGKLPYYMINDFPMMAREYIKNKKLK